MEWPILLHLQHIRNPEKEQNEANEGKKVVAETGNPIGHGHVTTVVPQNVLGDNPSPGKGPPSKNVGSSVGVSPQSEVWRRSVDVH
jgi:hypothetical protein